ncbi:hypothetical protein LTR10_011916 [Elasticomyces elasticus]|nr:hypothetical protein LTR10_011916 [Elasticomyces elasticus]KAK4968859.1 hypothetical protein LTR42_009137 [Elasticomyces elasticus]
MAWRGHMQLSAIPSAWRDEVRDPKFEYSLTPVVKDEAAAQDVSDSTEAANPPIDHVFAPKLGPTAYADPSEANTCDQAFRAHGEEEFNSSLDGNGATASPQATQSTARAKRLRDIPQQRLEAAERLRTIPEGYLEAVQKHHLTMLWHQGCDIDDLTSRSIVTDSDVWN